MASFGCADTPISFPPNFKLTSIVPDTTTKLRLIPFAPGPLSGNLDAKNSGIIVDENPNTELLISNPDNSKNAQYRYSQYDTRLYIPSSHKLPGVNAVGEYCIFFRNQADASKLVCLSLVLVEGLKSDSTVPYFNLVGTTTLGHIKRPLLTTLFSPDDMFIEYVGADLRNRTKLDATPTNQCDAPTFVTYFVCTTPVSFGGENLARFYSALQLLPPASPNALPTPRLDISSPPGPSLGPPQPSSAGTYNLFKYVSLVKGIQIGYPTKGSSGPNGTQTSALKCYRIDPAKDISGGQVVIKSAAAGTLAQELGVPAEETVGKSVEAGDIETYVAATVGGVLGVVGIIGLVLWFRSPRKDQAAVIKAFQVAVKAVQRKGIDPNAENAENTEDTEDTEPAKTAVLPKESIFYATIGIILGFIVALFLWLCFFTTSGGAFMGVIITALIAIFGAIYISFNYFTPPK